MHKRLHLSGYSIVELLIAISVIGTLSGLIFTGYIAYLKNGTRANIASTTAAYRNATKSATFEDDAPIAATSGTKGCISTNTLRCCIFVVPDEVSCAKNGESGFDSAVYTSVNRYISGSSPPSLNNINDGVSIACAAPITNDNAPCRTNDYAFIYGYPGDSPKGAIVYYVPKEYNCESEDLMVYNATTGVFRYDQSADFSRRKTTGPKQFTECVVGIH